MIEIKPENKKFIKVGLLCLVLIFLLHICMGFFGPRSMRNWDDRNPNIISITGHGEVNAVADIATISFSIIKEAKTVKEAQDGVAKVEKASLDSLKANKVALKDIKTSNASFYPKYEYKYEKSLVPCNEYGCPPQNGKNVITGYESRETISVNVRDTDSVGKIIQDLGSLGVTDLNGPNFSIDNEDGLKAEARKKAIDDAKMKAKVLASDLGVRLGHITSFNESGNYPMPMMYADSAMMKVGSGGAATAPAELPKGENTITSDVTITYEIR